MINKKSLSTLQLIPENFQRSSKSLNTLIKKQISEDEKQVKPIKFLILNQEKNNKLSTGQFENYKQLLRAGASSFIFYIFKKKSCSENYFNQLQMIEIKVPLIDITLQVGIYVWDYIYYIDQKSLNVYQFQCILGDQEQENNKLLFVVSQLASKIVIIIEDYNQEKNEIVEKLKSFGYMEKIDIFNLIQKIQNSIYNDIDQIRYVDLYENNLWEKAYSNKNSSKVEIRLWQEETLMQVYKKTYQDIEIDILTVLSIVNYLKQFNFSEENHNLIFLNAIKKQIEYSRKDIQDQFKLEIQKLCSNSNQIQQNQLLCLLNQIRNNAQSQFYQQLQQFQKLEEYQRQFIELSQFINNIEEDCLNLFHDVAHYDLLQRMKHNIKSQKSNDSFLNHYQNFLSLLSNFDDIMGVKYKYLKKHFKKKYNNLIKSHIYCTYEVKQIEFIKQIEYEIEGLQKSINQLQIEIEDLDYKLKISQSKHHTRQSSLQTTIGLFQSSNNESLQKLNQKIETLQSQANIQAKQ